MDKRRDPSWLTPSFNPPRAAGRAVALSLAAARRELWRGYHTAPTGQLRAELALREYCLDPRSHALPVRSPRQRLTGWHIRVITTELNRRGETT